MKVFRSAILLLFLSALAAFPQTPANEPPRPLTDRGLENLVAFTRLLGYVRHFHPSDQAAAADWDKVVIAGVQAVEKAAGPAELARALEDVFRPLAPTVRVYLTGTTPPPLPALEGKEVVSWVHHGVVLVQQPSMYKSERVSRPAGSVEKPFQADLGGGVSALVPLALYRDEKGTLPHGDAAPPAPAKPEDFMPSGNDRATRLAAVALGWNVPQHFYPYFDVVKTDWPAVLRRSLQAAATDPDERAFLDTLRRMVAALHDGHASVWHSSDPWSGRLPLFWDWIEGQVVITHAAPEAGAVRRGDVVLRLNGQPMAEALAAREELVSGASPEWRRHTALFTLALGAKDNEVQLEVRHPDGKVETAALKRSHPPGGPGSLEAPRPEKLAELRPGVFYLDLTRIGDDDFRAALDRLTAAKGIVFDLRGHPGGLSTVVLAHLTDQPLASTRHATPIHTRPDRQGTELEPLTSSIQPEAPRLKAKTAFLTDWNAISYAENYLLPVEHYHLADIVGTPTAGTTGNVAPFALPGDYLVLWTALKVQKHDGSQFHGVGIRPNVPAAPTLKGVIEGRDEVLEKGLEVVADDAGKP